MKIARLQKLSKDKLIELLLDKENRIRAIKEESSGQNVGEIFFKDKIYRVILCEVEVRKE